MALKRYKNPPGGPEKKFSFVTTLLKPLTHRRPQVPDQFVIPSDIALQEYQKLVSHDTLTWLGHSTFLLKLGNRTILTDPFLTDYASPFEKIGPKRFTPPGMATSNLPKIDMIIITHDHFDHLDLKTLNRLPNKSSIQIIVPLGFTPLLKHLGFKHIQELDWYHSFDVDGFTICALPAYHYSKRNLFVHNTRLWASYIIEYKGKKLFYSCDTAYGDIFPEIGKKYGPFDYALLGIGGYEPAHVLLTVHSSPEQAVQIGLDLQAKKIIAMHWGTIQLSTEFPFEPPKRFYNAAIKANFLDESIWIFKIGETKKI